MESSTDPCKICGETETKLIDGFYYCIECGTQNTNVMETILEERFLADGTFAHTSRRKIIKLKEQGIEMSGEWYKWHAFNFIISGLADELITLGAHTTFKTKLLWIWTRYIKKYQNKQELMYNNTTQGENGQTGLLGSAADKNIGPEEEIIEEQNSKMSSKRDVNNFSRGVIVAMLYIALNLDESDIQLSHLYRFCLEKKLNIANLKRFVPVEIDMKKIPGWKNFLFSKLGAQHQVRAIALSLLIKLDLGTPKIPDMKKIVNNFLLELSLPNDMKQFVYSLICYRKCDYLDIDKRALKCLNRIPDYEVVVMAFIIVALKMCFGLDCDYEIKLSTIVERINEERNLLKSYKIGKYSESTDRLFSFREWCNYLRFRKVMLGKHNLHIAEKYYLDVDDYVYLDQMEARPKKNEELTEKITMEIISKIPQENRIGIIPKELFIPTLTPLSDYTDVIIDYCQDPEVKLLLAEDFKRYSLKYACENLSFCDLNFDYIIKGVSEEGKTKGNNILGTISIKKAETKMIYIKNCENRNWLKTKPPTIEHVTTITSENKSNDKESDHGYDSESTPKENHSTNVLDESDYAIIDAGITEIPPTTELGNQEIIAEEYADNYITDESSKDGATSSQESSEEIIAEGNEEKNITDGHLNGEPTAKNISNQDIIVEEDVDKNIFDDDFEDLTIKEECDRNKYDQDRIDEVENDDNRIQTNYEWDEDFDRRSNISSDSFVPAFNPDTFDRSNTIKELILFACKTYKIPIPAEYRTQEPRKRKEPTFGNEGSKKYKRTKYDGKLTVKDLLNSYHNHVQSDFVTKIQKEINLAIRNSEFADHTEQNNDMNKLRTDSTIENGCNSPTAQSERHSSVGPIDQQELTINDTNNTDANDRPDLIDENRENALFENDEEMNLDDLISKGDPKFDETKYNVDQLYLKIKTEPPDISFEFGSDPEIDKLLLKNSERCDLRESTKSKPNLKENCDDNKEESDSEDEMPLSAIKEEIILIQDLYRQEESYERLIKKENIPEFKYWVRHYDKEFMDRSKDWYIKFNEELKENLPSSFHFVLQECALILNCSNFYLYKHLQILENYFICKSKKVDWKILDTNDCLAGDFEDTPE